MGIDLGDVVVRHPTGMEALAGKTVAFDAWNILYQFLSNIRQPDGTPLMDREGRVTSHLAGVLYRTANLVEAGVRPVFVFDGEPHPLKAATLAARRVRREKAQVELAAAQAAGDDETALTKAKQTSKLTPPMVEQAQELLRALGIPVVQAAMEGEAAAAALCAQGRADAVCSQDFDALLFGAPVLVRNLTVTGRRKVPGRQVWVQVEAEEVRLEESLAAMGATRETLIDAALLIGTDFNAGVHGIGPKKALQLVARHGGLDALLEDLHGRPRDGLSAAERAVLDQEDALAERATVRGIFLHPEAPPQASLALGRPDLERVRAFMVDRHGFSRARVDAALQRFATRPQGQQKGLFEF